MNSIEQAVINALRKLGCSVEHVNPVHELHGDLGVDSTEMVELAALVKSDCGVTLRPIDLRQVRTVADLSNRIRSLSEGAKAES